MGKCFLVVRMLVMHVLLGLGRVLGQTGVVLWSLALLCSACVSAPAHPQSSNDCAQVIYRNDVPGDPLRLPGTPAVLPKEYRALPLTEDVPWFVDAEQAVEARAQQHLIGQPLPTRTPLLGGAAPQCPANPIQATIVEAERQAELAGAEVGAKFGEVLGRVEVGIEMLQRWPHNGVTLDRILNHPVERDAFFHAVAKDLSEIPELPTYTEANLARMARVGFEKGYRDSVDAAHKRAWLVNVGVDVFFMAVGGIAQALESAGAKILDLAIMRLRGMPIFVPGTVGATGYFIKIAPQVVEGSSRKLLGNMLRAGKKPLPGETPHHVVAHADPRAAIAREVLKKFDVHVDSAPNGVFLPGTTKSPNPLGKAVHAKVHTDAYYQVVEKALLDATSKHEVINTLERLASQLERGGL